jgi:hypothetical protein
VLGERNRDLFDERDLLVAPKASVLDQDDACVKLALADKLLEVAHVQGHQDAVFGVRAVEQLVISGAFQAPVPHVPRIDTDGRERDCRSRRNVLIE